MKKLLVYTCVLLCTIMYILPARAETLTSLAAVQKKIGTAGPGALSARPVDVVLTGTVAALYAEIPDGWYIYRAQIPGDGQAAYIMGYEHPSFLFRSAEPLEIGETVTVRGEINALYSSPLLPFVGSATVERDAP